MAASEKGVLIEDISILQIGVQIPHFGGFIIAQLSGTCILRLCYRRDLNGLKQLCYDVSCGLCAIYY